MKLIEADKVERAIKDYWKAYVDRMPTPYSTEEFEKFANRTAMCFEHRDELLKEIKALPSAEPERETGHWIPATNGRGGHQCDRCGCYAPSYKSGAEWLSNFCPECNADMRGEAE